VRLTRSFAPSDGPGQKRWRAPLDSGSVLGGLIALALLITAGWGFTRLAGALAGPAEDWPISFGLFALLAGSLAAIALGLVLLARLLRDATLHYTMDRDAIVVHRRGSRFTIPLDRIEYVTPVDRSETPLAFITRSFGRGTPAQTLLIETTGSRYTIAVAERERFLGELEQRRRMGVVRSLPEGVTHARPSAAAFWNDRAVRLLLTLLVALNLALWTLMTARYPELPDTVPVRFDPIGGTAGIRSRVYTMLLPLVGSIMALANTLLARLSFRRTPLGAELLLAGAVIVNVLLLIAAWFIAAAR
jgi:hypothetical protein